MALNINFRSDYGENVEAVIKRTFYVDYPEAIAVIVYAKSEYGDFYEPYQKLSVNLNDDVQKGRKTIFLDTMQMDKDLVKQIERFGSYTGYEKKSGFVTYPAFRFFDSALEQMDEAGK